jgi:hypothetical protein
MGALAAVFLRFVLEGKRKFSHIPSSVKKEVREELISMGREDLIDEK